MKATDLMIGDYVINTEFGKNIIDTIEIVEPQRVWLTHSRTYIPFEYIEPIPLTKEILENHGFSSLNDEMFSACETETYSNHELKIYLSHIGCEYNPVQLVVYMGYEPQERVVLRMMPCQYVHELQHALRLCKIDKDIKL